MKLKTFLDNTVTYAWGSFLFHFVNFLLIPIYTHSLSITDYGLLLTSLVTIEIMTIFMGMQMTPAFIRFYKEFESRNLIGRLCGTSIVMILTGCFLVGGVSLAFLSSLLKKFDFSGEALPYVGAVCWVAMVKSLHTHMVSYFRAQNDALSYNIFNVYSSLLTLLLSILLLSVLHLGVEAALIALALSYGVIAIYVFLKISKVIRLSFSLAIVPQLFDFGVPLVLSAAAWFILDASDRYFVAHFIGLEAVGIYGLGYRIATVLLLLVVTPFQLAYGPFTFTILGQQDAKEKLALLFFYLVSALLVVGFGIGAGSRTLLRFIAPPEYASAYLVVLAILPASVMIGVYYWASALIHIVKKTYWIGLVTALASGLNLLLNYLLIPRLGWVGAALATNISFLLATATVFLLGMHLFPVPLRGQFLVAITNIVSTFSGTAAYIRCLTTIWRWRVKNYLGAIALRATGSWRSNRQRMFQAEGVKRILIWATCEGLGDAVNSIAMIRALKTKLNRPYLTVVCCQEAARALYSTLEEVDEVIQMPLSLQYSRAPKIGFLKRIRSRHYDLMIQDPISWPSVYPSSFFYSIFSRIRYKVGYFDLVSALCNTWVLFPDSTEHISKMKLRLVEEILGSPDKADRSFPISCHVRTWAKESIVSAFGRKPNKLVAFHVGASYLDLKAWPLPNFIKLGWRLVNSYGIKLVLVGGKNEEIVCKPMLNMFGGDIAGFLGCTLEKTAAIIEQCDLFVGNDSGPTHLAASVGTPIVAIYGPTDYIRTSPYGSKNIVLRVQSSCSPCWCPHYHWERFIRLSAKRKKCMPAKCLQDLQVDQVFSASVSFLNKQTSAFSNSGQRIAEFTKRMS